MLQKIKSRNGATLLIALGFFLLCAVVGSIVLTAGSTSSGRIAGLSEQEQSYYTVTSAAKLVMEEIEGQRYYLETDTDANNQNVSSDDTAARLDKALGSILKTCVESVKTEGTGGSTLVAQQANFTITGSDAKFGEITGTLKMATDYSVVVTLWESDNPNSYRCDVTFPVANSSTDYTYSQMVLDNGNPTGETKEYRKIITDLRWITGTITKAGATT